MTKTGTISHRKVDGCVVLDMHMSEINYANTDGVKNYVAHLLEAGETNFVFNLNEVNMIDSFGLAAIISLFRRAREKDGGVAMYGLSEQVQYLVEVTNLERVLEIWPSEAQAIYSITEM